MLVKIFDKIGFFKISYSIRSSHRFYIPSTSRSRCTTSTSLVFNSYSTNFFIYIWFLVLIYASKTAVVLFWSPIQSWYLCLACPYSSWNWHLVNTTNVVQLLVGKRFVHFYQVLVMWLCLLRSTLISTIMLSFLGVSTTFFSHSEKDCPGVVVVRITTQLSLIDILF